MSDSLLPHGLEPVSSGEELTKLCSIHTILICKGLLNDKDINSFVIFVETTFFQFVLSFYFLNVVFLI